MPADLGLQIREQLARYLASGLTLREFIEWYAPRARNAHQAGDPDAEYLADQVDLALAEFSNGDWTESQLRALLSQALNTYHVDYQPGPPPRPLRVATGTGTWGATVAVWATPSLSVGTRRGAVSE